MSTADAALAVLRGSMLLPLGGAMSTPVVLLRVDDDVELLPLGGAMSTSFPDADRCPVLAA